MKICDIENKGIIGGLLADRRFGLDNWQPPFVIGAFLPLPKKRR